MHLPSVASNCSEKISWALAVLLLAVVGGCGGGSPTTPPPAIAVTVNPTTASVQTSASQIFTATVANDSANMGAAWTLSGTGCSAAACGTLSAATSASGAAITYTAPAAVPSPATVTLTAASVADGTKTMTATITVTAPSAPLTVAISPKRTALTTGQKQLFTATVTGNSNTSVTWEVDTIAGGNATVGTIDASGNYSPPSSAGTHTVGARSVADTTAVATTSAAITDFAGVFTYHNNLARDGTNTKEYALTSATVKTATFGKLFSCTLDGAVYAQPLWMANLTIGAAQHNVLLSVSMRDSVYLFDADTNPCSQLWKKTLLPSGETYVDSSELGTQDIYRDIGILGTPVIDSASKIVYLVTKSKTTSGTTVYHQRLHALNLGDGSEAANSPVELDSAITAAGNCEGGATLSFNTKTENQRPALALVNGVVYVTWASHGDVDPYHGWVVGYKTADLSRTGIFNSSPNLAAGQSYCRSGIWMAGGAPAADAANNLYLSTGNGTYDADSGGSNYGDSFLRLATASGLAVGDWFTPSIQASLDAADLDLGSGGTVVLVDLPNAPHPHLLIGGGKGLTFKGDLYVLNRDSLGQDTTLGVLQEFAVGGAIFSTEAFWQNTLYVAGVAAPLRAYSLNTTTGLFDTVNVPQSSNSFSFPGSTPTVSASGTTNGIVWALDSSVFGTNNGGSSAAAPAVLHAYDAANVATELWNSTMGTGNTAGNSVKFTVPTVANGKVYVPTRGDDTTLNSPTARGRIDVYGLLPN